MRKAFIAYSIIMMINILTFGQKEKVIKKELTDYQWYGERFDWILDLYGRHPNHKDSIRLFISEIGGGRDTFLVLHGGFGAEHSYMLDALISLADRAHFIFYDQRGSLRSYCPDSVISLENHVNDIERIRKAFKIEHINIIAHSMGTFLAMNYLKKYPLNAGKLILLSSLPVKLITKEGKDNYSKYQQEVMQKLYAQQEVLWQPALHSHGFDTSSFKVKNISRSNFMYMQQFWAAAGKVSDYNNWEKDNTGSSFLFNRTAAAAVKDIPEYWDFTEDFKKHTYSISILKGSGDYLSPQIIRENVQGIKNVYFIEIKNAGHSIWIEQPMLFGTEMQKAFNR